MNKYFCILSLCILFGLSVAGSPIMAQVPPCQCGYGDGRLTLTSPALDGDMSDWNAVLNDVDNVTCDGTGQNDDRDYPVQSTGRDLDSFALTWDQNHLYGFARRFASSKNNDKFIFYADTDNNQLMNTGEPVIVVFWKGNNRDVRVYVGSYVAANSGGDPLVDAEGYADGYNMPGEINAAAVGHPDYEGNWGSGSGLEMEWSVTWNDLGVAPGTAISWHVSSTNKQPKASNISANIDDNLGGCGGGAFDTGFADLTLSQTNHDSVQAGQTYYLPHTITNNGNVTDTPNLETTTSGDFSINSITYYEDKGTIGKYDNGTDTPLTDSDGDNIPDAGALSPNESKHILLKASIPSGTHQGSVVLTSAATSSYDSQHVSSSTSDTLTIVHQIDGIVFEDETGDLLNDGDAQLNNLSGDQTAKSGVKVYLFKDGGDGIPDGTDDQVVAKTTTGTDGRYSFNTVQGNYWVVVNSQTGTLTNGTSWAEQTYGPAGAYCTDGDQNTTILNAGGACFGGRRGAVSDQIPQNPTEADLSSAEHLAHVEISDRNVTNINFGFSFNVVTQVRDGDDISASSRTVQGSFRQFIQNANSISGQNIMRFTPVIPQNAPTNNGWNILVTQSLPPITGNQTIINGTAYYPTDNNSKRDDNSGSVGTGGNVGTNHTVLNRFDQKELEIDLNNQGPLLANISGTLAIKHFAIFDNSTSGIEIQNVSSAQFAYLFLGTTSEGQDPGSNAHLTTGIKLNGSTGYTVSIHDSYFAYNDGNGVKANNQITGHVAKSEFYKNALTNGESDGLSVIGNWSIQENLFHQNGNSSSDPVRGGAGVELGDPDGSIYTTVIQNNTFSSNHMTGITVLDHTNGVEISGNIINNNGPSNSSGSTSVGAGIKLTMPDNKNLNGIKISRNSIFGNRGLGIDLVTDYNGTSEAGQADGVTPNDGQTTNATSEPNAGLDYPIIDKASLDNGVLHIEGYVGKSNNTISGTFTIELYKADDDGNNAGPVIVNDGKSVPHGEGRWYIVALTTHNDGTFNKDITVPNGISLKNGDFLTATATDNNGNTSEFSNNVEIISSGATISGVVWSDTNHNGMMESGESGIGQVTLVLHNISSGSCSSVHSDDQGNYEFNNISSGKYSIIESAGEQVPAPQNCPANEKDPDEYVSTTSNKLNISVTGSNISGKNFGDFHGSKITGHVFVDDGNNGGTPNDGKLNGEESGLDNIQVILKNGNQSTEYETSRTNGNGAYTLWMSNSHSGQNLGIYEVNMTGYISTGADIAGLPSSSTYNRSEDFIQFIPVSGKEYSSVNFGDVRVNSFLTSGSQNTGPGTILFFPHTYTAHSSGSVTFSLSNSANPSNSGWRQNIYKDDNCDGSLSSGEKIINSPTDLSRGEKVCLLIKAYIPSGAPENATNAIRINAHFKYQNASPDLDSNLTQSDQITVIKNSGNGLKIIKSVDKDNALPGAELTYSITYTNNSDKPIKRLEITDSTPAYTIFKTATCSSTPDKLTGCSIESPKDGEKGKVKWSFTGSLSPGSSGTVTYKVEIEQ